MKARFWCLFEAIKRAVRQYYPALRRAHEKGIAMYMTVQALWGYVQMFVYDTGRDIMELGVVPAANMLPEVAYIKLGCKIRDSFFCCVG